MPDIETMKLLAGPIGGLVVLAVLSWKQYARIIDLTDIVIGLVRDQTKAQEQDAAAARALHQRIEAAMTLGRQP